METYTTRYLAKKNMGTRDMAIVKVCGGYALMDWRDYYIWADQK